MDKHIEMLLQKGSIENWLSQGVLFSYEERQLIVGWGAMHWSPSPKEEEKVNFYFPDYFLDTLTPWLHCEHSCTISADALAQLISTIEEEDHGAMEWENPDPTLFEEKFQELQRQFQLKKLSKAVPYTFTKSPHPLSLNHKKKALLKILHTIQTSKMFAFGYWENSQGILGASPEILFSSRKENNTFDLHTMALAGTKKNDGVFTSMWEDKKLLHEHQIVVDDLTKKLTPFGRIKIGNIQELSLPLLKHLYTPISVRLSKKYAFSSFVTALHPTAALGGFPQKEALKWLKKYAKSLPRGRFGAPIGFWDRNRELQMCYVAIRCILWDGRGSQIGAGCGIVDGSDQKKEWEEILLKIEATKKALGLDESNVFHFPR